jgi:hypothetical protein
MHMYLDLLANCRLLRGYLGRSLVTADASNKKLPLELQP